MVSNQNNIIVKKDKPKKNDGGHKPFGVNIDPNKDLCHITNEDGSQDTYYKNSKMEYDDYVSELELRFDKKSKGKSISSGSIGLFGGWGEGKLKKPYKS